MKDETLLMIKEFGVDRTHMIYKYLKSRNQSTSRINIENVLEYWKDDSFSVLSKSSLPMKNVDLYNELGNYFSRQ